jgi:hypothetical protein
MIKKGYLPILTVFQAQVMFVISIALIQKETMLYVIAKCLFQEGRSY